MVTKSTRRGGECNQTWVLERAVNHFSEGRVAAGLVVRVVVMGGEIVMIKRYLLATCETVTITPKTTRRISAKQNLR